MADAWLANMKNPYGTLWMARDGHCVDVRLEDIVSDFDGLLHALNAEAQRAPFDTVRVLRRFGGVPGIFELDVVTTTVDRLKRALCGMTVHTCALFTIAECRAFGIPAGAEEQWSCGHKTHCLQMFRPFVGLFHGTIKFGDSKM
jgi:hypothetical protein